MSPNVYSGEASVPTGDRRSRPRLEVVGLLWGALDILEPARVVDISRGGVLIESPVAVPPGSEQLIQLSLDGQRIRVDVRACHMRQAISRTGTGVHYLIGYEFVSPPAALAEALE
jgi:hypothetical protein